MSQQPAQLLQTLPKTQADWQLLLNQLNTWQTILAQAIQVATAQAGWGTPTNNAIVANFDGSAATLSQCREALAEIILRLQAAGILAS